MMASDTAKNKHVQTEELIKYLQHVKLRQLYKLGRYPVLDKDVNLQGMKKVSNSETESHIIESLQVLDRPSERLLCKLQFDVTELAAEIRKKSQENFRKKIQTEYLLKGDKFLLEHVPVSTLVKSWYLELATKYTDKDIESGASTPPSMKEKLVYNMKYEPCCSDCKESCGLADVQGKQIVTMQRQKNATMSFSTSHKGYCYRITMQSQCHLCSDQGESDQRHKEKNEDVRIHIDPCIENQTKILSNSMTNPETAIKDILEQIWSWIDQLDQLVKEDQVLTT